VRNANKLFVTSRVNEIYENSSTPKDWDNGISELKMLSVEYPELMAYINNEISYIASKLSRQVEVKLVPPSLNLAMGASVVLKPAINPPDILNFDWVWESSNEQIAVVDGGGKVTATGVGTVKIWLLGPNRRTMAVCDVNARARQP